MPSFVNEIDVEEFYDQCSQSEVDSLIYLLKKDGFIPNPHKEITSSDLYEHQKIDILKSLYTLSLEELIEIENNVKK